MEEAYSDAHPDAPMQHRALATSESRLWDGVNVGLYEASGGFYARPATAQHSVIMYVGKSIRTACRCEGPSIERIQNVGDIDVIPAGAEARWNDYGPTTMLAIDLSPGLVNSTAEGLGLNIDREAFAPELFVRDAQIEHIGWALKAELEAREASNRLYAESLGIALAARLLTRYMSKGRARTTRGLSDRQLHRVDHYIMEHLDHNLSLAALAAVAGLSPSHFKALFKISKGLPVHQYVIRRRVDAAVKMLSANLPISQVALHAGFVDQSHLARCMRRVLGITPAIVQRDTKINTVVA